MAKNILICDDSPLVHKSMTRLLKDSYDINLYYAENGSDGLDKIAKNNIDVVFLDLTMPIMDGFEVLKRLPSFSYKPTIVIISADVQKEAARRCLMLGADYFLSKPFDKKKLKQLLSNLQITVLTNTTANDNTLSVDYIEGFREIANISLGRGAAIISDHLGEFIKMPLPYVATMQSSDLAMTIADIRSDHQSIAIAQRFVGGGIHGEALVDLRGKDILSFGEKLGFSQTNEDKNEVVIDISNIMVSSFLVALSEQISIPFSVRQPIILEEYMNLSQKEYEESDFFTVEYVYKAETLDLECEVLFMMDSHSTKVIHQIMETLN
ncbi:MULTISPECIES: response regulator [unclassified Photobacterium]|uniref:response regulator n=1 Tax=unclassified Photobacterium TaxID=2628852 RepID=UPI000D166F66|nr:MULTISPECIES: response regulator [unclassified Photobacterium]PSV27574.1 response regulator [Photobacterium sp. GB-56]PSV37246.1 response regulator [Photobacterium sp. GB-27]PSV53807.1 response regulator [Photobacterium sp. GB-1]